MKKIALVLITVILLLSVPALAEQPTGITVNGMSVVFEVPPYIENGRTFVSARAVVEMLGFDVEWDAEEQRIDIKSRSNTVVMKIGSKEFSVNGNVCEMDVPPHIKNNRTMVPIRFIAEAFGCAVSWNEETRTVEIVKKRVVEVSTAAELLENIADYTTLVLADGTYNLTEVFRDEDAKLSDKLVFDLGEYTINAVTDLTIKPAEDADARIVVEPRDEHVLYFKNCKGIELYDITAGHTIEAGTCSGGVVMLENVTGAKIDRCSFYGCGTYGINTYNTKGLNVTKTDIYDCTVGCISIVSSSDCRFENCLFRDSKDYAIFEFINSSDVEINKSIIKDNRSESGYFPFISGDNVENVSFTDCVFIDNVYDVFCNCEDIVIKE